MISRRRRRRIWYMKHIGNICTLETSRSKLQKFQLIHSLGQDRGLIATWDFDGLFFVKIAVYQVSDEGYILPPKRSEKGVMPPKHQQISKARLSQNQRILYNWHWSTLNTKNSHEIPTTFFNFAIQGTPAWSPRVSVMLSLEKRRLHAILPDSVVTNRRSNVPINVCHCLYLLRMGSNNQSFK